MAAASSSSPPPSSAAAATATSPTRSPSPLPLPAPPSAAPPSSSSRRLPPPCWTHEETLALIDSYRDKWYALRRGNLRAPHWQEVADAVARRCARLPAATPKTSVQCRHKVEKLRKRYRAERQRSLARDPSQPPVSSWAYFRIMDAMESGGGHPSRASASPAPPPSLSSSPSSSDDDEAEDPRARSGSGNGNTRSLHRLMANGGSGSGLGGSGSGLGGGGLRFTVPKAVRSKILGPRLEPPNLHATSSRSFKGYASGIRSMGAPDEMRRKREREGTGGSAAAEVAAALRALGDGYMRVEQMKMEMARETEKVRMEMELKRTEMVLDAQRRIMDTFVKGFFSKKHAKHSPES